MRAVGSLYYAGVPQGGDSWSRTEGVPNC